MEPENKVEEGSEQESIVVEEVVVERPDPAVSGNPRPGRWRFWCLDCPVKCKSLPKLKAHCAANGHREGIAGTGETKKAQTPALEPQATERTEAAEVKEPEVRAPGRRSFLDKVFFHPINPSR